MSPLCPYACFALLVLGCGGPNPSREDDPAPPAKIGIPQNQEPPQLFFLEFDGKKAPIELDKPVSADVFGSSKTITLRVEPYRVFPHGGLHFQYPREYTFKTDFDNPAVLLWTLSGPTAKIMIQRYRGQADHEAVRREFMKELAKEYKNAKKTETKTSVDLKKMTLEGRRIEVQLVASGKIQQDVYSLQDGRDSVLLILQDSPEEDGKPSKDRSRAEKMLRETLRLSGR
jgi:hypothetical protein